jgi:hypothetical protein
MRRFLIASALMCVAVQAHAQGYLRNYSRDELDRRTIERRATEAVIWGIPAVNYDLMLREMFNKTEGKVNQVLYWGQPIDWHNQTLMPNPDSIHFMVFFNTMYGGPVVIEIPAASDAGSIAGNIVNVWQTPLADVGRFGADKGEGGKYLLLPPGYSAAPPAGFIPLQSDTYGGYATLRSELVSHSAGDVAKSVAYGKQIKIYPLARAANPPPTIFTDAGNVLFDTTIRYDESFFVALDHIVQNEPWLARDNAMIDQLRSVGIVKGQPFEPSSQMKGLLSGSARLAQATLEAKYDAGLPPFYGEDSHWTYPVLQDFLNYARRTSPEHTAYPIDARGLTFSYGHADPRNLGVGLFYLLAIKDNHGGSLDGGSVYRLTVPSNVPVEQYWSVTAYDRETHALIRNMARASRASRDAGLQKNADGSVDIYFGPDAPKGKDANWIATDPQHDFELMFRFYAPRKELFDKTWKLPDPERLVTTVGSGGAH